MKKLLLRLPIFSLFFISVIAVISSNALITQGSRRTLKKSNMLNINLQNKNTGYSADTTAQKLSTKILTDEEHFFGDSVKYATFNPDDKLAINPEVSEPLNPLGCAQIYVSGNVNIKYPSSNWIELVTGNKIGYLNPVFELKPQSKITLDFHDAKIHARAIAKPFQFTLVSDPITTKSVLVEMFQQGEIFVEESNPKDSFISVRTTRSYVQLQHNSNLEVKLEYNKYEIFNVGCGFAYLATYKRDNVFKTVIKTGERALVDFIGKPKLSTIMNIKWVGNWAIQISKKQNW